MKLRIETVAALLIVIMMGRASSLQAQYNGYRVYQKWEFSLFGGAGFLSDRNLLTPVEGERESRTVGVENDSGYVLGVRVTENLSRRFGAELEYSVSDQSLQFQNLKSTVPVLDLDQKVHQLTYNILFYPAGRFHSFRPFLSVGGGATFFQVDSDSEGAALLEGINVRDRWKPAFNFGGGVKHTFNRNWGMRVDVRDQITGVPDYGLPSVSPVIDGIIEAGLRPDGVLHNWQFTVGISYFWDGIRR